MHEFLSPDGEIACQQIQREDSTVYSVQWMTQRRGQGVKVMVELSDYCPLLLGSSAP